MRSVASRQMRQCQLNFKRHGFLKDVHHFRQYQLIFKAAWDLTRIDSLKFSAVEFTFKGERQATIGGGSEDVKCRPVGKKWRGGGASTTWEWSLRRALLPRRRSSQRITHVLAAAHPSWAFQRGRQSAKPPNTIHPAGWPITGPGCISASVIGPLRLRDIIIVVKRSRGDPAGRPAGWSVGDGRGGWLAYVGHRSYDESTLPQGSFDRNSKLDIWRTG